MHGSGLGGRERFETPGEGTGVSNQGGDGHKREVDELDDYLGCTTSKFNSHWIIHLHVNSKTETSRRKLWKYLNGLGFGEDFINMYIKHKQ